MGLSLALATAAAAAPKVRVVEVQDVRAMLEAIGPGTTVRLRPGTYDLSTVPPGSVKNRWLKAEEVPGGHEWTITGVSRFRLVGLDPKRVKVVTPTPYATVLRLDRVRDVELKNLELGHHPDPGVCDGGVLRVQKSQGVTLTNCDLFGSGTIGLDSRSSSRLRVMGGVIRDCSSWLVRAFYTRDLVIDGAELIDTQPRLADSAIHFHEAWGVRFQGVTLRTGFPQRKPVEALLSLGLPAKAVAVTSSTLVAPGAGAAPPTRPDQVGAETFPPPAPGVHRVRTARQLQDALASGRTLELLPGEYRVPLSVGLRLKALKGVTLRGLGRERPVLYSESLQAPVLTLEGVEDLTLEHLAIGHRVHRKHREEGSIKARRCRGLTLRDVELFGGGSIGLDLDDVEGLRVTDSTLRGYTVAVVSFQAVRDAQLRDLRVELEAPDADGYPYEYANFSQYDSEDVAWTRCVVQPAVPGELDIEGLLVGDAEGVSQTACRLLPPRGR